MLVRGRCTGDDRYHSRSHLHGRSGVRLQVHPPPGWPIGAPVRRDHHETLAVGEVGERHGSLPAATPPGGGEQQVGDLPGAVTDAPAGGAVERGVEAPRHAPEGALTDELQDTLDRVHARPPSSWPRYDACTIFSTVARPPFSRRHTDRRLVGAEIVEGPGARLSHYADFTKPCRLQEPLEPLRIRQREARTSARTALDHGDSPTARGRIPRFVIGTVPWIWSSVMHACAVNGIRWTSRSKARASPPSAPV